MGISVIIPTLNAGRDIVELLSLLALQDERPSEIIIIDSSSEDDTVDIARRRGAKTMVIPRRTFDHGRTRNIAAKEAKGEILVFMTQDALPSGTGLLTSLTAPLRTGGDIAASYGRHVPRPDASLLEIFAREFNYPDSSIIKSKDDIGRCGIKAFFFSNVCSAFEREKFFEVGMFPEGIRANEDMLAAARLILKGYKVAYAADAAVIHSHDYSPFGQFKRYFDTGSSLRNNRWILQYAASEREGLRFVKNQLRFLLERRCYSRMPYALLEDAAKYAGYIIGLIAG